MRGVPSFVGVVLRQADTRRRSARVQLVGGRFPAPARATLILWAGVRHGKDVSNPRLDRRLAVKAGAAVGTVVPVCRWMDIEPQAAPTVCCGLDFLESGAAGDGHIGSPCL
jgi:hypothetical protein